MLYIQHADIIHGNMSKYRKGFIATNSALMATEIALTVV